MARHPLVEDEGVRSARLLDAQAKAAELFAAVELGSDKPMRRTDRNGQACHWILEVHLVDTDLRIGGFFEELWPGVSISGTIVTKRSAA